jgi:hypothetical protein
MATIITTEGKVKELQDTNLESLQAAVGGYIEILQLHDGKCLVVDEEGKIKNKPQNVTATLIYLEGRRHTFDVIVGDAVLCTRKELK